MNERLAKQAEIEKLSRLLGVTTAELAFLNSLQSKAIREIAGRVSDTLHDSGEEKFRRIAKTTKLVPSSVSAAIAQRFLGPLASAMVAVNLDPKKAAELTGHLEPGFLAEVSLHLDPRRAEDIIARIPDDLVVRVAGELVAREEYITMGRFVGYVSRDAIIRAVESMAPDQVLHTAFFVEAEERFDEIVAALPDERLREVISTAATDDLWVEALSIVDAVGEENRKRLADLAGGLDTEILDSMARSADEHEVFDVILPLIAVMTEDNRKRIAGLSYLHRPEVVERVLATVAENDLWTEIDAIEPFLPEDVQKSVADAREA